MGGGAGSPPDFSLASARLPAGGGTSRGGARPRPLLGPVHLQLFTVSDSQPAAWRLVQDRRRAELRLFRAKKKEKKTWHAYCERTSDFEGSLTNERVCMCVCSGMCVLHTWVFDRLGERERGWTECGGWSGGSGDG